MNNHKSDDTPIRQ